MRVLESRRLLLKTITASMWFTLAGKRIAEAQAPQPIASPNAPSNQNAPAGMDSPALVHADRGPINSVNQAQIAGDVQQLYTLAYELREEVTHTNVRAMLPLDVVKKAQQIEKLAKQIKQMAKG